MTEFSFFVMGVVGTLLTSTIVSLVDFKLNLNSLKRSLTELKTIGDKKIDGVSKKIETDKTNLEKVINNALETLDKKIQLVQKVSDERFDATRKLSDERFDGTNLRMTNELQNIMREMHTRSNTTYNDSELRAKIEYLEKFISEVSVEVSGLKKPKTKKVSN